MVKNDQLTEKRTATSDSGGGGGGIFPAETAPEIPEVTVDSVVEIYKEVVKEKSSNTQSRLHRHNQ